MNDITIVDDSYQEIMKVSNFLAKGTIVPTQYKNNPANCFIALQISQRMKMDVMTVMQNLNIIAGRPAWSSQFLISLIDEKFPDWEFKYLDKGIKKDIVYLKYDNGLAIQMKFPEIADKECWVEATNHTGKKLKGIPVSLEMAIKEGWYTKNGSKWPTMTDLMLQYRAASFFASMYLSKEKRGVMTKEEAEDIEQPRNITPEKNESKLSRQEIIDKIAKIMATNFYNDAEKEECRKLIINTKDNDTLYFHFLEYEKDFLERSGNHSFTENAEKGFEGVTNG